MNITIAKSGNDDSFVVLNHSGFGASVLVFSKWDRLDAIFEAVERVNKEAEAEAVNEKMRYAGLDRLSGVGVGVTTDAVQEDIRKPDPTVGSYDEIPF